MSLSPRPKGSVLPVMTVQLFQDGPIPGQAGSPFNLGSTLASALSLTILNTATNTDQAGAGTFTIINAAQGLIQYAFNSADVATAGSYLLFVGATLAGGLLDWDGIPLTIVPK